MAPKKPETTPSTSTSSTSRITRQTSSLSPPSTQEYTIDNPSATSDDMSPLAQLRAEMEARFQIQQEENQRLREQLEQANHPPVRSVSFAPPPPLVYESIEETSRQASRPQSHMSHVSHASHATRIEKIPNLSDKLSDGVSYSPRLWEVQVKNTLERWDRYFYDDTHKKDWILAQTEGTARSFLEPFFLEASYNADNDALALVEELVSFLANPAEQQTARDQYNALRMKQSDTFWTFYQQFRTLASTARMLDDNMLRMDLRDKIAPRLRRQLHSEYAKSNSLGQWVAAIQAEDQGQIAERTVYANQQDAANYSSFSLRRIVSKPIEK